jgi:N-glycosylase/DNA lyase
MTVPQIDAATGRPEGWKQLTTCPHELRLATTLMGGQCFRWRPVHVEGRQLGTCWACVLPKCGLVVLHQCAKGGVWYQDNGNQADDLHAQLQAYFQLDIPLKPLYAEWASKDAHFAGIAPLFPGIRVMRQDPLENILSFICSSNNNIARISKMVEALCVEYGQPVGSLRGVQDLDAKVEDDQVPFHAFHSFPKLHELTEPASAGTLETRLRELGFGYRAKYIQQTVNHLASKPSDYLESLRKLEYATCRQGMSWLFIIFDAFGSRTPHATELLQLAGVGPKVADCIALMSMDQPRAIPVDTHVYQIAERDYRFRMTGRSHKSLTPRKYEAIGTLFYGLWGAYCGWAHTVLFMADLRQFEGQLSSQASPIPPPVKKRVKHEMFPP